MAELAGSLDVKLLTRELKSVQNRWFELGIRLDVQYSVLKGIKNAHSDTTAGLQLIDMLQYWLQSNPSCSWSTIIEGLREIDEISLAQTLASTYGSTDQSLEFPDNCSSVRRRSSVMSVGDKKPSGLLKYIPARQSNSDIHIPETPTLSEASIMDNFDVDMYDDLKSSYAHMLTAFRQYLGTIDLEEVKFFLQTVVEGVNFNSCETPDQVIEQMRNNLHVLNVKILEQLTEKFPNDQMHMALKVYNEKKVTFCRKTNISDYHHAMLELPKDRCEVKFKVTAAADLGQKVEDIVQYAKEAFGPWYNDLSEINREPSSEFVTWTLPKDRAAEGIRWVKAKLSKLREHGVEEVIIAGITLCCCPQKVPSAETNTGARVQVQLSQANTKIEEQHQQLTSKSNELKQKNDEIRQLTLHCCELEHKNEEVQHLTQRCLELEQKLKQKNELAEEQEKQHCELEQENEALKEQLVQANMRADELVQEANLKCDKLGQENETLQHHLLQANAAAEEILQQATERSSELEQRYQTELSHANMQSSEVQQENQVLQQQITQRTRELERVQEQLLLLRSTSTQVVPQQGIDQSLTMSRQVVQAANRRAEYAEERARMAEEKAHRLDQQTQQLSATMSEDEQPWVVRREEVELTNVEVGTGSWGKVIEAKFRGVRVAAKCMHQVIISDYNRRQFTREMAISAKLRHPNLVLFIAATTEGTPLILSELMVTSLRKELEKRKMPSKAHIISVSRDVACALCYMHQWRPQPIIHRDISSGNVLLEFLPNRWRAKVSDYGSAIFMNFANTVSPGSLAYGAPEARYSEQQSPKMDVFSLGVLMIEMCLREHPEVRKEQREAHIKRIKWPAMGNLIRWCISESPGDRPSMGDVLFTLEGI